MWVIAKLQADSIPVVTTYAATLTGYLPGKHGACAHGKLSQHDWLFSSPVILTCTKICQSMLAA